MSKLTNSELCWICGQRQADSHEHKIKASVLKRHYGKNYPGNSMIYGQGELTFAFDSYKSDYLLFPKVICRTCNESLTRPHDESYDKFLEFVDNNYDSLFQDKQINFREIYGENWKNRKLELYRYIAKHAGCKIVTADRDYNIKPLAAFIRGDETLEKLKVHFQLKEGIKIILEHPECSAANIGNGRTIWFNDHKSCLSYAGWTYYQWISIVWIASENIKSPNDFELFIEPLEIRYFRDCDPLDKSKNLQELYLTIEYSGIGNDVDLREYYMDLLQH